MADKIFARVDLVALFIQLRARQQHFGFDPHQRCGHQDKLAGELNIEALELMEIGQKVVGDLGYRYVVNIQFVAFNEEKKEVKRPFKQRQMDLEIFFQHKCGAKLKQD